MAYYASGLYDTEQQALEASIYDYVTACGDIDFEEALDSATEERQETIDDARADGWAWDQDDRRSGLESWGVHRGGSSASEPCDFDHIDLNAAFDMVAARLREEIEEAA